jgi:hypothetical protein
VVQCSVADVKNLPRVEEGLLQRAQKPRERIGNVPDDHYQIEFQSAPENIEKQSENILGIAPQHPNTMVQRT